MPELAISPFRTVVVQLKHRVGNAPPQKIAVETVEKGHDAKKPKKRDTIKMVD